MAAPRLPAPKHWLIIIINYIQDNPSIDDNTEIETAMLGQQDGDDLDTSADATETDLHDGVSSQQELEQVDGEDNMTGGDDMASQNESKDDVDCEMTEEKDENMEVDDSKVVTGTFQGSKEIRQLPII